MLKITLLCNGENCYVIAKLLTLSRLYNTFNLNFVSTFKYNNLAIQDSVQPIFNSNSQLTGFLV